MVTRDFITAGRAMFTLEMEPGFAAANDLPAHYTYRVNKSHGDRPVWFVSLLTGPDNESDYTYLGLLDPFTGGIRLTGKSAYPLESMPVVLVKRITANIWGGTPERIEAAGFKLHHEGRCGRCGRTLTVPESIESGFGPECITRVFAA